MTELRATCCRGLEASMMPTMLLSLMRHVSAKDRANPACTVPGWT